MSRYSNVKKFTHADGTVLDSKREYQRYCDLILLERAGAIADLKVHPRFKVTIGGVPIMIKSKRYHKGRHLTYVADFQYFDFQLGDLVIEDVKMQSGHRTEVYKIKRALMDAMGKPVTEY